MDAVQHRGIVTRWMRGVVTWTCALVVAAYPRASFGQLSIGDITEQVAFNERLYDNVDVLLGERYRDTGTPGTFVGKHMEVITASRNDVHYVAQDGMFRLDMSRDRTLGEKNMPQQVYETRMFDRETTRLFVTNKQKHPGIANVIKGRSDDDRAIRPHTLLLRNTNIGVPLSTYMKGRAAIEACPGGRLSPDITLKVEYKGEDKVDELLCHVISLTHNMKATGAPHDRWVLWLAEARNFIPVKREGYMFRISDNKPVCEGRVTGWRELRKGVWYPTGAAITRYDDLSYEVAKEWKEKVHYEYAVKSVSLEPKYNAAYFSELTFPAGTAVYQVEGRKITGRYREGLPSAESGGSARLWLMWAGMGVCGVVLLVWYLRSGSSS